MANRSEGKSITVRQLGIVIVHNGKVVGRYNGADYLDSTAFRNGVPVIGACVFKQLTVAETAEKLGISKAKATDLRQNMADPRIHETIGEKLRLKHLGYVPAACKVAA